jgi:bifunctional non-homologous end joining protein LigD
MVVEVAFSEWTPDGHVRHPTFRGVRSDKPGKDITRERAKTPPGSSSAPVSRVTSVKVTNPDRVIDPSTGLKKVDLVRYYESIAEWMLPHLKDRPVSLVRAPTGITGELFFQKHPETKMPGMTELDPALWPGHSALLAVNSAESLVAAAQMNTVEFHTWNSTTKRINQPDRVIFDLDPGEGVTWVQLQEAAMLTHSMLQGLGLVCWLKTSGGKGLHVVVPLAPKLDYENVKGFSQAVVQHMARVIPQRFVSKSGTGSARSLSTTCATATGRRPLPRSRHAPGPGWGSPCRCPGSSFLPSRAGRSGPFERRASTSRSRRPTRGPATGSPSRR